MTAQLIVEELILLSVAGAVFGVPLWKIFAKSGFSPWWTLLLFIPPFGVGPVLVMIFLAFRKWPETEMEK